MIFKFSYQLLDNILQSSNKIEVNTHATNSLVTIVLFSCGSCPATKACEVCECLWVVIVSVPERKVTSVSVTSWAKDALPLVVTWVNTACDSAVWLTGVYELLVPASVCSGASRPILGAFNVKPNFTRPAACAVGLEVAYHRADLWCGASWASWAWEHIDITSSNTSLSGIAEGATSCGINSTIWKPCSCAYCVVAISFQALSNWEGHRLAHINTEAWVRFNFNSVGVHSVHSHKWADKESCLKHIKY